MVNGTKINVRVDNRQLKYVEKEFPPGSRVILKLEGSNWTIVSKPSTDEVFIPETGVSYMDALETSKTEVS